MGRGDDARDNQTMRVSEGGKDKDQRSETGYLRDGDWCAPTLHPCISETPNANLSFPPDSVFLVVTGKEKSDKQLSAHTINSNSGGIDGKHDETSGWCWRGAKTHPYEFFVHSRGI